MKKVEAKEEFDLLKEVKGKLLGVTQKHLEEDESEEGVPPKDHRQFVVEEQPECQVKQKVKNNRPY
jgi:hypothetical protein